jgi:hypothetical protein
VLEENGTYTLECDHSYHKTCLQKSLKFFEKYNKNRTCPYCRQSWNLKKFLKQIEKDNFIANGKLLCIDDYVLINSSTLKNKIGKIYAVTPTMYRVEIVEDGTVPPEKPQKRLVKQNKVVLHEG